MGHPIDQTSKCTHRSYWDENSITEVTCHMEESIFFYHGSLGLFAVTFWMPEMTSYSIHSLIKCSGKLRRVKSGS